MKSVYRFKHGEQTRALLYHARKSSPFCSDAGQAFVSVPGSIDARQVWPIRSPKFRDWLIMEFFNEYEIPPTAGSLRHALCMLEAQARHGEFPAAPIYRRIGRTQTDSEAIVIDLADPDAKVAVITHEGWRIDSAYSHAFRRGQSTLPLPIPQPSAEPSRPTALPESFTQLRALLNLNGQADFHRVLAWLVAALRPTGPYPILVLQGPPASGKSTAARMLRALIDPSSAPLRRLPEHAREISALAAHNWILAFDEVERIPASVASALNSLASGDGRTLREPEPSREPLLFTEQRPILLIDSAEPRPTAHWTPPKRLARRSLAAHFAFLPHPRTQEDLWSEFESAAPSVLAALYDASASALASHRSMQLEVPRLADTAQWIAAAAPKILSSLFSPDAIWQPRDALAEAVGSLLATKKEWTGRASDLHDALSTISPAGPLPASTRNLSERIQNLRGVDVIRSRSRTGDRILTIRKQPFDANPVFHAPKQHKANDNS